MNAPDTVPLRVDFGGAWLDCPRFARAGAFVVNCTCSPMVGLDKWPYNKPGAGLGGSAAWRLLKGEDCVAGELSAGVGWQDPAVIMETGLCVWRSGPRPVLDLKVNPDFLAGLMGLKWMDGEHFTPDVAARSRSYGLIEMAGSMAADAVRRRSIERLSRAVAISYCVQRDEGMDPLPLVPGSLVRKYCGAGWGGYALYLFDTREARDKSGLLRIEPYMKDASCSI